MPQSKWLAYRLQTCSPQRRLQQETVDDDLRQPVRSQPSARPAGMHLRPSSQPGRARIRRGAHDAVPAGRESEPSLAERRENLRGRRRLGGAAADFSQGRRAPRVPERRWCRNRARRDLAVFPTENRDRSVRAGRRDREEGPQGWLHSDHLRDADHHGAPDGLLYQARSQRRSDQDRRLGGDPRQDHQQGIRRRAHALADAARAHAWRRLEPGALHGAGD